MKMMRAYGGQAIAVYQASNRAGVEDLLAKGRVDYIFQADYRAGSALEATVQDIIRKMAVTDRLWEENARQVRKHRGRRAAGAGGPVLSWTAETAGEGAAAPSPKNV